MTLIEVAPMGSAFGCWGQKLLIGNPPAYHGSRVEI
jgi:hypothetical protein